MSIRIEYICHATLLIEVDGVKILTDPWISEPAYANQWHIFPKPVEGVENKIKDVDYILISHGHEDHLHEPTLQKLDKKAEVFFPYTWYDNAAKYFKSLGFADAREVTSWKKVKITDELYITYISHNLDSVIVIEHKGKVIVNVNDALHASNIKVIEFFATQIKKKWKQIDYVFCGFGGAAYFPNCFHADTKDDIEIAAARESLFTANFCHIIYALNPKTAVPFAADFALLNPETKWINSSRINRALLPEIYKEIYPDSNIDVVPMYPGDWLNEHQLIAQSDYRNQMKDGSLSHLIDSQYADKIKELEEIHWKTEKEQKQLIDVFEENVKSRWEPIKERLNGLFFNVHITDMEGTSNFQIDCRGGGVQFLRSNNVSNEIQAEVKLRSEILEYSLASDWGGDCITIGYGAQIYLKNGVNIDESKALLAIRLLTKHPREASFLVKNPVRGLNFVMANPIHKDFLLKRITGRKNSLREKLYGNNHTYDASQWLTKDKCEICKICGIPDLEEKYFE